MRRVWLIMGFMFMLGQVPGVAAEKAADVPLTPDNVLGGMPGPKAVETAKVAEVAPRMQSGPGKRFSHFQSLKPGSIAPQGWARTYTRMIADGWVALYATEKPNAVYAYYWQHSKTGGEIGYSSYFAEGWSHLSTMLPESRTARDFDPWLEKVMAAQEKDGYMGECDPPARWHDVLDGQSQSYLIDAMLWRYQATGDPKLLAAGERSARRLIKAWGQDQKEVNNGIFAGTGSVIISTMRNLYLLTGKPEYRDLAKQVFDRYGRAGFYLDDPKALPNNTPKFWFVGLHSVVESWLLGHPAMIYEITGDAKALQASIKGWDYLNQFVMVDGQLTGNELITKKVPRAIGEHCTAVTWSITNHELARITGDVKYADMAERCILNAYPGSKSTDTLTLAYMHSANQLVASEWSHPHNDDYDFELSREYYSTAHPPLCCNSISPRAMPYYVENSVMQTSAGLAVVYYSPFQATAQVPGAGEVRLAQESNYPFEDEVRIKVTPQRKAEFTIELRVPGWCSSATIEVNGQPLAIKVTPGKYESIRRTWMEQDLVVMRMQVPIRLEEFNLSNGWSGYSPHPSMVHEPGVAVMRGPLTFAMPVEEKWQPATLPQTAASAKTSKAYRVFVKEGSKWNYALILDPKNLDRCFEVKRHAIAEGVSPWATRPMELEVSAREVLGWQMDGSPEHPLTPALPYLPMKLSPTVTKVRLVPFGCTHLRMAYLPSTDK